MRILIVEDEALVAAYMADVFEELGHGEIHTASSIEAAHALLSSLTPEFAVLDVNVGAALVFPLAAELSARKIPFVFSSGKGPDTFPAEWRGHPFVPKPLQKELLVSAMRGLGIGV